MKCLEIDLNHIPKITMLNCERFAFPKLHVSRTVTEYILYIIVDGHLELYMDNEPLTLSEGDVYIFDRNKFQRPVKSTDCTFFFIHFQPGEHCRELFLDDAEYIQMVRGNRTEFLKKNVYGSSCYDCMKVLLKQKMKINKAFLEYISGILQNNTITYTNNDLARRLNISYVVSDIFMKLEDAATDISTSPGKSLQVYNTVSRIADYIKENYMLPFESSDIEKALHINFDYANRIFKRQFGYSIIRYRNILRINTAKTMMHSTNKTFGEIAEETGFRDRYYFSRYFKSVEGISPSDYRERFLERK